MATIPSGFRDWAGSVFTNASAPILDVFILAFAIGLSIIGLLRTIGLKQEFDSPVRFYNKDFAFLAALPILILVMVFAARDDNQG